jgi:catechol 2,3-dioxygenase-like lactoylglutathione lyase family enzyme
LGQNTVWVPDALKFVEPANCRVKCAQSRAGENQLELLPQFLDVMAIFAKLGGTIGSGERALQCPGDLSRDGNAFSDRATVDAFYKAALAAGGRDNGAPGLRPEYHPGYYGAFVYDPDGNNIEAVWYDPARKEK